jgi:hypothetical protein
VARARHLRHEFTSQFGARRSRSERTGGAFRFASVNPLRNHRSPTRQLPAAMCAAPISHSS